MIIIIINVMNKFIINPVAEIMTETLRSYSISRSGSKFYMKRSKYLCMN